MAFEQLLDSFTRCLGTNNASPSPCREDDDHANDEKFSPYQRSKKRDLNEVDLHSSGKSRKNAKKDIFRPRNALPRLQDKRSNSFLNLRALCFANPIGDSLCGKAEHVSETSRSRNNLASTPLEPETSDSQTVSTNTVTSTQYFEDKHNFNASNIQPMPLFEDHHIDSFDWRRHALLGMQDEDDLDAIIAASAANIQTAPRDVHIKSSNIKQKQITNEEDFVPDMVTLSGSRSTVSNRSRSASSTGSPKDSASRKKSYGNAFRRRVREQH